MISRTVVGYAVINSFTFAIDLALLVGLHSGAGWPLGLSITVGYVVAFALSYVLNRWLNFRSRAPVGPQVAVYVVIVVANYALLILGVGDGLTHLGVDYRVSRLAAAGCEAVFMYCAMRWIVFRDVLPAGLRPAWQGHGDRRPPIT